MVVGRPVGPGEAVPVVVEVVRGQGRAKGIPVEMPRRHPVTRVGHLFDHAAADGTAHAIREAAALDAMSAWQRAMEGTVNPAKLRDGMSNCIFGCPSDVARQIRERYDPDDRLMLWFDFNNHKTDEVERMMTDFVEHVVPLLEAGEP